MPEKHRESRLGTLESILAAGGGGAFPPVETWNPPDCGDIGLAILADGTWMYRESPISRLSLVHLFARVLRRDEDGTTYLVTPVEKIKVNVADAPFVAVELEMDIEGVAADRKLTFRTNVGDVVACGPSHPLRFAIDETTGAVKPYLRVRGRLEALLTRALTYEVLEQACVSDPPGVWSRGEFYPVPD